MVVAVRAIECIEENAFSNNSNSSSNKKCLCLSLHSSRNNAMLSGLRQRRQQGFLIDDELPLDAPLLRKVAQVDFFPKPKEEFRRVQTAEGAAVSLIAVVLIGLLLLWETGAYIVGRDAYHSELTVDKSLSETVPFNFDITFQSLPCHELSLDAMDAAGGLDINVDHDLYKSPVDRSGKLVFQGKYNYVDKRYGADGKLLPESHYDERRDPKSPKFCGSCYIEPNHHRHYDKPGGLVDTHLASVHKDACCNTCDSVMKMYDAHRIPRPSPTEVEQCMHELSHSNPGCNIRGTLHLKKVMGNVHFAPGTSALGPGGQHIHLYDYEQLLRFNTSHVVNHLSIGERTVNRFSSRGVHYALDGAKYTVGGGYGYIKYFLQVVPTTYSTATHSAHAFEFSAQVFHREFPIGFGGQLPSVFFVFDFHPIAIKNHFERPSLSHFFVQVCGIVGGLFVVLGLVDRLVETAWCKIRQHSS